MTYKAFDDVRLCLNEREHLGARYLYPAAEEAQGIRFTSAGFLFKNVAVIFAKWDAIIISVFMSSAGRSRTVSQNGLRSWSWWPMQVSTIDQMSLQSTSVAT